MEPRSLLELHTSKLQMPLLHFQHGDRHIREEFQNLKPRFVFRRCFRGSGHGHSSSWFLCPSWPSLFHLCVLEFPWRLGWLIGWIGVGGGTLGASQCDFWIMSVMHENGLGSKRMRRVGVLLLRAMEDSVVMYCLQMKTGTHRFLARSISGPSLTFFFLSIW